MTDEAFMELVERGIAALSPKVRARMKNVAIVIADEPNARQRRENNLEEGETLFGLYEGVPQTERGLIDEPLLPDKITIFKLPILETYADPADIAACVANTVWHEVAHHFGMEEEEVEREEERRGKTL
jgi:predicted Zn-dependent protease with MMP-like domain